MRRNEYLPEGAGPLFPDNQPLSALQLAMEDQTILTGMAIRCDAQRDLTVRFGGYEGTIPRLDAIHPSISGAERDIAILSRVGKPTSFTVTAIDVDGGGRPRLTLSRRAAQERCMRQYIDGLVPGDVIPARVTHLEPFGVFADIGCGIPALLPIDSISVSRIGHPRERFLPGMDIKVIVKDRDRGRINLSHKELLGTWAQNAGRFQAGETVGGVIRSIESYGVFVELAPNLAGLAESRENIFPGQQASVFIKSVLPGRMKVKLIIIETFDSEPRRPRPPEYFFDGGHMDEFLYSPPESEKVIKTVF